MFPYQANLIPFRVNMFTKQICADFLMMSAEQKKKCGNDNKPAGRNNCVDFVNIILIRDNNIFIVKGVLARGDYQSF